MNRNLRSRLQVIPLGAFVGAVFLSLPANTPSMAMQRKVAKPTEVRLSTAEVTFHTTDDDKEKDTAVSLYIKLNDGTVIAQFENIKDYFKNRATSKYLRKVVTQIPKTSIQGCTSILKTKRVEGHDTWKFYYEVKFTFSDGSSTQKKCPPVTIGENDTKVCPL